MASKPRQIIVISDLHMGEGKYENTDLWYPAEDFRWPQQFAKFLKKIDEEGGGATDLIINGDLFELWESSTCDCKDDRGDDFGCTEKEAVSRLKRVLKAHKTEMKALGEFAESRENRLIIIPGNHDAALLFPKVREEALREIGAGAKVSFAANGYWLSDDKLVYLEHGHQIGHDLNKWKQWPSPFLEGRGGKRFLQCPWGEKFVQDYYNRFETEFPVIDNISKRSEGIYYIWKAEGTPQTVKDAGSLLKFILFEVSWQQFGQGLGKKGTRKWDIKAIRDKGPQFLIESLPSDHPFSALIRDPNNNKVQQQLAEFSTQLTDEDIIYICEERAYLAAEQDKKKIQRTVTRCPEKKRGLGRGVEKIREWGSPKIGDSTEMVLSEHLGKGLDPAINKDFKIFIFGHTHKADGPRELNCGHWNLSIVNSGAWVRVADPDQITTIRENKKLPKEETLSKLFPEDLPARYSYVHIKPYPKGKVPKAELLYWVGEEPPAGP